MNKVAARNALLTIFVGTVAAISCADAQQLQQPYTTSSNLQAQQLDEGTAKAISNFLSLPVKSQHRKQLSAEVCKSGVTRPDSAAEQVKVALALTEADIVAELQFANSSDSTASTKYLFDFSQDAILIRSSNPRYESQSEGLRIAYPHESTKTIWFEGKQETSVLFLIPPVRDCSTQFVLACPRSYSKSRTLEGTPVTIQAARYFSSAKADGLFKAPEGKEGKIQASLLSSSRITLPATWSAENVSRETPSASLKQHRLLDTRSSAVPFTTISVPFEDTLEARLEFGLPTEVLRVLSTRATFAVQPAPMATPQNVRIELADVSLQPGSCFVISRRKESHY